jgi:phosphoribosylformimino-5-aminoimidazole carboxamide ribotide isomerase
MNNPHINPTRFTLYPAIDLKDGQVVRLKQGDLAQVTVFNSDPAAQADLFAAAGAQFIHLVDLNGAFEGYPVNARAVESILARFPGRIQLGGGIRDAVAIDRWLRLGISRVVLGTAALTNPELVRTAAKFHPGKIVVAVDARDGFVATEGWAKTSTLTVVELAKRFEDAGVSALLFTDIGRDGLLGGVNIDATLALCAATRLPVIASGGVGDMGDLQRLHQASKQCHGVLEGVIVGRALYDGRIELRQALDLVAQDQVSEQTGPLLC